MESPATSSANLAEVEAAIRETLLDADEMVVEYLQEVGYIQNQMFVTIFPNVSEDTVLRDLQDLIKKGLIKKVGSTKAARYVIV